MSLAPSTCYIAAAMNSVPAKERERHGEDREAIAEFFREAYQHTCSNFKVLLVTPEEPKNDEERISIVAADFTLVSSADLFVLCYESEEDSSLESGKKPEGYFSWGAAAELGFAYASGKPIVVFNLTTASLPLFVKHLPEDPNHVKYIIASEEDLMSFTKSYKPKSFPSGVELAGKAETLAEILASKIFPRVQTVEDH